jgi:ABC-type transporter Mla subunit MlaD
LHLFHSGLRVGVLYSHNAALLSAFDNIAYFAAVANDTQDTLAAICEDREWVASFFAANRAALRTAFQSLAPTLRTAGIPFVEVS